jgi:hypothetical protein
MPRDVATAYLQETRSRFHQLKEHAERAVAQVPPDTFFAALEVEANSIGVLMKHIGGNLRSRFRDFLTTDGEKGDRNRDREFEREPADSVDSVLTLWNEGWAHLSNALAELTPDDLLKTVRVRGEAHTVIQALDRALVHVAGHVGQIVLLAKHAAGTSWRTLSIPRGGSDAYLKEMLDRHRGR